jgi:hypothetical protein
MAYVPHDPEQGSASRYGQGCRCSGCRAGHTARLLFYQWRRRNLPKIDRRLAEIESEMRAALTTPAGREVLKDRHRAHTDS